MSQKPGEADQSEDAAILERLRLHDHDALAKVADRFGMALVGAASLFLGDHHAAEDLAQETLIRAWDSAGRMRADSRLEPWLFGILFNLCRRHRRSLWRRLRREKHAVDHPVAPAPMILEHQEQLTRVQAAISRLDDEHRAVIILRFEQNMGVAQTGLVLGIPEGTVKSRTHVALEKLRLYLK
jgi:RNA polymerase sigma-70 factor (ECF subfamily)